MKKTIINHRVTHTHTQIDAANNSINAISIHGSKLYSHKLLHNRIMVYCEHFQQQKACLTRTKVALEQKRASVGFR